MRPFLLVLTLVAFAANSILNRMAVDGGHADPGTFATLRVLSGAMMLVVLVLLQRKPLVFASRQRLLGAATLSLYMAGFSVAYRTLDAGLGALILFGSVQITMFVISAMRGVGPTGQQILGAAIAFGGLIIVLNPSGARGADLLGAAFMVAAGIGWAVYTLSGRSEPDALAGTAANFCRALPLTSLVPLLATGPLNMTPTGAGLAVVSGAVTSGLGYALWYSLLPGLAPAIAAILQLCVPVIAVLGGVLLLGETVGLRFAAGAALVLGGVALSLARRR